MQFDSEFWTAISTWLPSVVAVIVTGIVAIVTQRSSHKTLVLQQKAALAERWRDHKLEAHRTFWSVAEGERLSWAATMYGDTNAKKWDGVPFREAGAGVRLLGGPKTIDLAIQIGEKFSEIMDDPKVNKTDPDLEWVDARDAELRDLIGKYADAAHVELRVDAD